MASLDEDDILNPEETLERHELGIDTSFLVKHLGKGSVEDSDEKHSVSSYNLRMTENEYFKNSLWPDQSGIDTLPN